MRKCSRTYSQQGKWYWSIRFWGFLHQPNRMEVFSWLSSDKAIFIYQENSPFSFEFVVPWYKMVQHRIGIIECVGWRHHSSLIILILLFTKLNIKVRLYQTKIHFTHIFNEPFSRVTPPNYIALWHPRLVDDLILFKVNCV